MINLPLLGWPTAVLIAAVSVAACGGANGTTDAAMPTQVQTTEAITTMTSLAQAPIPLVKGFYDGEEITFIHTEASSPQIASTLTQMMGSRVIVVPELADVAESALGNVYVFTNGVVGSGPMGFQADVFDSAPDDPDYSPLRSVNFVTWHSESAARLLTSAEEIEAAASNGELKIERPGVVVNMPFVTWPSGSR